MKVVVGVDDLNWKQRRPAVKAIPVSDRMTLVTVWRLVLLVIDKEVP